MGRPRLAPQDRHTESVRVPLRPADFAALQAKADQAETTLTDFVRAAALGQKFTVTDSNAPDFDTVEQLRRIGVNLNQIAKHMNQGRAVPSADVSRVVTKLETLLTRWIVDDPKNNNGPQF